MSWTVTESACTWPMLKMLTPLPDGVLKTIGIAVNVGGLVLDGIILG